MTQVDENLTEKANFEAIGTGVGCEATGNLTYRYSVYDYTASVERLTVVGQHATFWGPITKVGKDNPPQYTVGKWVSFNVFDSTQPDGTGDGFNSRGVFGDVPEGCPINEFTIVPITKGDVIVKPGVVIP